MFDPLMIVTALLCGMLARAVRLPALVGYLAAGFVLHELGATGGILLSQLAETGVTLLLFSIGLKLRPAELLRTNVWGTTVSHMLISILVFAPLLVATASLVASMDGFGWTQALLIAFALSFSSTVFVIQVLQERGETASRHSSLAVGILLVQDIAAVAFIAVSTGKVPEWTALGLLLLIPGRVLILRAMAFCGHGELLTLYGLALAVLGAQVFEAVGIKGDLGALILGALLAGNQQAKELADSLLQFKNLFLVGFFINIGLLGWPRPELLVLAAMIAVLAPLKAPLYFWLMARFRTEPRTAFLGSVALSNYSEFGLIVIAIAVQEELIGGEWTAAIALTIALSFLFASALNARSHELHARWRPRLQQFRSPELDFEHTNTDGVRILVLGMGAVGSSVFDAVRERHGDAVLGVEEDETKVRAHASAGRRVVEADASDPDFWSGLRLHDVEQIMLAMKNHENNKLVGKQLRELGYEGYITAIVQFRDQSEELEEFGIESFDLLSEAGRGFAEHAEESRRHAVGGARRDASRTREHADAAASPSR